jgi:PAS domain S-box-containing protein
LHEKGIRHGEDEAKKLTRILNGNAIPTFVIDSTHRITHWNRACELLTGLPATEMIGTDRHREAFYFERRPVMVDFVVSQSGIAALRPFYGNKVKHSQFIEGGYEAEDFFPKFGPNGKWLFFTAAPLRDADGTISGAVETLQDVTDRHMAEQQLRNNVSRYRQLFESANDAIFLLHEGAIADCNPKALELFECTRSAIIGHTPMDFSPEIQPTGERSDEEIRKKTESLLQNIPHFFEWRFVTANNRPFDAEVSITRFLVSDRPYALAIVRDISDHKALIQRLKKRQAELDEKTRYLEKANLALKNSLDHREVEKRAIEENIIVNLKRFVFPYLEKLENCRISADARAYLNILQTNLHEITSQFSETIFSKYVDLTPTEIRIADFIRDGKDSKEIAHILGLSPSSVHWHRKNIREKLQLNLKSIASKLIIGGLAAVMIPLAVVGYLSYSKAETALHNLSAHQAEGIASDLARLTNTILESEKSRAGALSAEKTIQTLALSVKMSGLEASSHQVEEVFNDLKKQFAEMGHGYQGIFIADANGRIYTGVLENGDAYQNLDISKTEYFQRTREAGTDIISEMTFSKATSKPIVMACAPIKSPTGEFLGILATVIKAEFFTDLSRFQLESVSAIRTATYTHLHRDFLPLTERPKNFR